MKMLNLSLRFLLELAGIAASAYWGATVVDGPVAVVLAIAAPAVLIGIWGMVVAPKARNSIGQEARIFIGTGLLLLAALGLWWAGQETLALAFGAVTLGNTLLMVMLGGPAELS